MRYSQPFGTPDPPLGTYPRYVNGNPVTGTEGSIPPASSFDEDQIEIINVIVNAKGGADGLPGDPTLGDPDHTQLNQLWKALVSLFAQHYITTHITRTVHGTGADFTDLNAAMTWLAHYVITPSGLVTFIINPGVWNYTQTVEINHPNANRIIISGGGLNSALPGQGGLSVTWPFGPSTWQTDGSQQHHQLQLIYKAELVFLGGISGFVVYRGGVTFSNLLISAGNFLVTAPAPPNGDPGGCGIVTQGSVVILDGTAVWGWGFAGYYSRGGAFMSYGSPTITASYCQSAGFWTFGGLISFPASQVTVTTSCGQAGWICFGTEVYSGILDNRGHQTSQTISGGGASNVGAISVEQGTQFMAAAGSLTRYCNNIGITVADASTCQYSGSTCMDCKTWQVWMNNGVCWCEGSNLQMVPGTVFPNGGVAVLQNGAALSILGASVGGYAVPTPNTYGQANNSFIRF